MTCDVRDRVDGKNSEQIYLLLFFSKWRSEQWQSFDLNQNVAILQNYNGLLC